MYVYMYVCMYTYKYIYIYIYIYTHTNIYTYTYIYIYICIDVCICLVYVLRDAMVVCAAVLIDRVAVLQLDLEAPVCLEELGHDARLAVQRLGRRWIDR